MLKSLTDGGIARALRHRNYRNYVGGDGISLIGNWVQRVAIGWLTWELTHSGLWLGIIAMAELFPSIFCAPLGGALADKHDRRLIAIWAEVLLLAQALALALLTWSGLIDIWSLVFLTFLRGVFNAGSHPARQALVPSLVPPSDLSSAIAFNSMVFNIARFIGPVVSGFIIAQLGNSIAFAYNAASFI
ncbi:MAG: MFS transporter, partial [Thermomicrobiales bacterium]